MKNVINKWYIQDFGSNFYEATRKLSSGSFQRHSLKSHCLWCAKTDLLAKFGGKVDLRGWHRARCGIYTYAMQQDINREVSE